MWEKTSNVETRDQSGQRFVVLVPSWCLLAGHVKKKVSSSDALEIILSTDLDLVHLKWNICPQIASVHSKAPERHQKDCYIDSCLDLDG